MENFGPGTNKIGFFPSGVVLRIDEGNIATLWALSSNKEVSSQFIKLCYLKHKWASSLPTQG